MIGLSRCRCAFVALLLALFSAAPLRAGESEVRVFTGSVPSISVQYRSFEHELLERVLSDTQFQFAALRSRQNLHVLPTLNELGTEFTSNQSLSPTPSRFAGHVRMVNGTVVEYLAHDGLIDWYSSDGRRKGSFVARDLAMELWGGSAEATKSLQRKCPLCVIGGAILIGAGICALTENAGMTVCSNQCACGFASYSRRCFAGYAEVQCICRTCPIPQIPVPGPYPGGPGGAGPFIPGLPWNFSDGSPWIVEGSITDPP